MPAGSMKYGGRKFRLIVKTRLKSTAKKKAKAIRDKGLTARIAKIGTMHGVFAGPSDKR